MDMFRHSEDRISMEAVGGSGMGNIFRAVDDSRPQRKRLISVGYSMISFGYYFIPLNEQSGNLLHA
jgi:muramoyltetrapeptide carboxypeptidase LdcA involved in peptidoglycan recycling